MKNIYPELFLINELVFESCGLQLSNLEIQLESKEYFAHDFLLDQHRVKFRQAKITPTKTGHLYQFGNEMGMALLHHLTPTILLIFL